MHTSFIKRISVDAANKYLATASDDKTVRVWEVATGRLLRTIRGPVGGGDQGKFFAVALSPDGQTLAAGGFISPEGLTTNIYIFERESGRLLRQLTGLPEIVNHLVFSPDGRYLAVMLNKGIRVYQTQGYSVAFEDRDYEERSLGGDFARAGQLVTTCLDGFIRLYEPTGGGGLRLVTKQKLAVGKLPVSANFSPDSSRVAVGFGDTQKVAVVSSRDLSELYVPDSSGVNGALASVAWSADGAVLYSGGHANDGRRMIIRSWANGGRGAYRDNPIDAVNAISQLLPLRNGGVVYCTADPTFGTLDGNGKQGLLVSAAIADYRGNFPGILLAQDGSGLRFAYETYGRSPTYFSLSDRKLDAAAPAGSGGWRPHALEAVGIHVTDWFGTFEPKLNGARLYLESYEISRSIAIAPDASSFALGSDTRLHLFNRSGVELWRIPTPSAAWEVNISGDGRFVLVAYGDGTIRWHRMTDGKELLAFFPHKDRKRWVLWTPSGYYDTSPGAEDLIGWHVNNGLDAADFFPVGQFRNVYYRPDVVTKVLQTGDVQLALSEANEEAGRKQTQEAALVQLLPPVVEIVSPEDGSESTSNEVVVRFRLRTPSGEPVTEVRALVDGRPAAADRGVSIRTSASAATDVRELKVSVPDGESQVSVIASNRFTTSVPATVRVRVRKSPASALANKAGGGSAGPAAGDAFEIKPKLYVLAVGVSAYEDPKLKLSFAAKDASDFAAAMARQKGGLYRDVIVKLLTDESANKDDILDGLEWIRKETTSHDVAMVLFAGHGFNNQSGRYYYLPYNANLDRLLRTGVSVEDIKNTLSALAGKTLLFIDTCHSGNVLGGKRSPVGANIVGVINELSSAENGTVVFAASTGYQDSLENPAWNNGAFTLAVVEGIGGRADYMGKGYISVNMLDLYISERVKELTGGRQTPTTAKPNTVPDFPIALKR
jgi:WD40 repeat protein